MKSPDSLLRERFDPCAALGAVSLLFYRVLEMAGEVWVGGRRAPRFTGSRSRSDKLLGSERERGGSSGPRPIGEGDDAFFFFFFFQN